MRTSSIHYTIAPNDEQLAAAADLIDYGGQLAEKLDRYRFQQSSVIVVAFEDAKVVGVAAVKRRRGDAAETGYLVVHKNYRRIGIGNYLLTRRIEESRKQGLAFLYTNVRAMNEESIGNLKKSGFQFWGNFISRYGTPHIISWFFYPLIDQVDFHARMKVLTDGMKSVT
jgi:GNAT superfamily N-acetyltransferase